MDLGNQQEIEHVAMTWKGGNPGSRFHPTACSPCSYHMREAGCYKGQECDFCHLCGKAERKKKRAKSAHKKEQQAARQQVAPRHFEQSVGWPACAPCLAHSAARCGASDAGRPWACGSIPAGSMPAELMWALRRALLI